MAPPLAHPPPRPRHRRLASWLYHASFSLFLVLLAALLVGSAWGLGEQAWRTDHQRRWNMFALIAAYIALAVISLVHIWSRVLSVKKILRTMPKPYMPTKHLDVTKKVAVHIATEFTRTAVITHVSQVKTCMHEGWGSPGTRWEGVHYRTFILSTLTEMRSLLCPTAGGSPLATAPFIRAADALSAAPKGQLDPLRVFVASYANIVERAQYARSEPSEEDAAATEKVVALIRNLLEVRRERERGYNEKSDRDRPPVGGKLEYPYPEKAVESDESEF